MNIAIRSRLNADLQDLIYENDYYIQSIFIPKTKTTKKLRNEEWNTIRSFEKHFQFIFAKQIVTISINKGTYMTKRKVSKISPDIVLNFKYYDKYDGRERTMKLNIMNSNLLSTKLNYFIPKEARSESWMDEDGKLIYSMEELKKDIEDVKDENKLLYHFLLNGSRWGLSGDIISELYYTMGYHKDQKLKDVDIERLYKNIKKLLVSNFLLGGKNPELDGEMGEFFRNYKIFGKKNSKIERINYRGNSLFFIKKNNNDILTKENQ